MKTGGKTQKSLEMWWKRKDDEMLIKTSVKYMTIMSWDGL